MNKGSWSGKWRKEIVCSFSGLTLRLNLFNICLDTIIYLVAKTDFKSAVNQIYIIAHLHGGCIISQCFTSYDACCLALASQNARTVSEHLCERLAEVHSASLSVKAFGSKEDSVVLSALRKAVCMIQWMLCVLYGKNKQQTSTTQNSKHSS